MVIEGRLRLRLSYQTQLHLRTTIEGLAASFGQALAELISHCRAAEEPVLTPSDFSLAELDDAAFQKVAALLGEGEDE
jgi:non-ribosomal peptide synthase protein (TIGR01720 family)